MKVVKNLALLTLALLSVLNRFIPKFKIIIFFTNNAESNDNNRALLNQLVSLNANKEYKLYFFSRDGKKYKHFEQVKYRNVYLAPIYFLVAKYCFYDCGTLKIRPSKKQYVISLWHGVPLKQIGLMINEQSSKLDKYNDFSKILVPSKSWMDIYQKCFECTLDQIFINGFPRNDFLFCPAYNKLSLLGINYEYEKNILWMPTFRSSISGRYNDLDSNKAWDLPIFNTVAELSEFNKFLASINCQLVIKLHPYSTLNLNAPKNFSHLVFVRNSDLNKHGIINYEFVACFDALVTDYSSILFDYLLTGKPMAFTIDDFEGYSNKRGFTVSDPDKYLVGEKIMDANGFARFVKLIASGTDNFVSMRREVRNEVHCFTDGKSTERLLKEIKLL